MGKHEISTSKHNTIIGARSFVTDLISYHRSVHVCPAREMEQVMTMDEPNLVIADQEKNDKDKNNDHRVLTPLELKEWCLPADYLTAYGVLNGKSWPDKNYTVSLSVSVLLDDPSVLIEGVLFRARYLGSTQLVCEGQPTKSTRMCQAEEAVSRIKVRESNYVRSFVG